MADFDRANIRSNKVKALLNRNIAQLGDIIQFHEHGRSYSCPNDVKN